MTATVKQDRVMTKITKDLAYYGVVVDQVLTARHCSKQHCGIKKWNSNILGIGGLPGYLDVVLVVSSRREYHYYCSAKTFC